jgi:hypothetical protein
MRARIRPGEIYDRVMPEPLPLPPEPLPPPGWLHDPRDGSKERYWDGAAWTDQTRHENSFKRRFHFSPYWLLGLFVALIVIWATGIFDKQLVGIGLNARDCFDPVDGEVVCGTEAEELIEQQENPLPTLPPSTPGTPPLPGDPGYPGGVPTTPGLPGDPTAPGGFPTVP